MARTHSCKPTAAVHCRATAGALSCGVRSRESTICNADGATRAASAAIKACSSAA